MKITNAIPVPFSRRRVSLLARLLYSIADVLALVNHPYNDYDIRERMGELTERELQADYARDVAHEQYHDMLHEFWGGC